MLFQKYCLCIFIIFLIVKILLDFSPFQVTEYNYSPLQDLRTWGLVAF